MSEPLIGTMDLDEIRLAMAWAEREGWQPGVGDAVPFHATDPIGFFHASIDGRTVATLSVVRGSASVAFVGLYIVDPEHRGRGIGKALWENVLARFDGFTLGLDAVPAQVSAYESAGFAPSHVNARYASADLPAPDGRIKTQRATDVGYQDLVAFDARHFFAPRPRFLRSWTAGEGRDALVTTEDGEITGFAASRRTSAGHRIGPVFADDPDSASALILELAARAGGPVAIDLPEANRAAVDLALSLGMERSFETTRMYRGPAPVLPLDRIYGITTLELG
jgi:GNAT superfamily N-acetyltransferase